MSTIDNNGSRTRDEILVTALAAGLSYQEAANAAACSKSTVARRMATPTFFAEVACARDEYVGMLRGRLLEAAPAAVMVLSDLMVTARSDADRVRAARALLDMQRKDLFFDQAEIGRVIRCVVNAAINHLSDEEQMAFVADLRALT
jgi:hypothetical protein